ncbi:hypothetical protein A6F55_24140 [Prescottella equi]|nr:hypothetical protein A6F55_24140 [Prescottella equi]
MDQSLTRQVIRLVDLPGCLGDVTVRQRQHSVRFVQAPPAFDVTCVERFHSESVEIFWLDGMFPDTIDGHRL